MNGCGFSSHGLLHLRWPTVAWAALVETHLMVPAPGPMMLCHSSSLNDAVGGRFNFSTQGLQTGVIEAEKRVMTAIQRFDQHFHGFFMSRILSFGKTVRCSTPFLAERSCCLKQRRGDPYESFMDFLFRLYGWFDPMDPGEYSRPTYLRFSQLWTAARLSVP